MSSFDGFERWLTFLPDNVAFSIPHVFDLESGDFYINPRYLRGSDFLMRWSQGRWSEEVILHAFERERDWIALPFVPSSVAPEDPKEIEAYFERLENSGVGKRPDLLILQRSVYRKIENQLLKMGIEEIPFTPDKHLQFLIGRSVCAVEVENSLWVSKEMPHYGKARPSKTDPTLTVFLKSQKVPTVIIKDEDLKPLSAWQNNWKVPIYIFHVFYDQGFFIRFDRALELIKRGIVEVYGADFLRSRRSNDQEGHI